MTWRGNLPSLGSSSNYSQPTSSWSCQFTVSDGYRSATHDFATGQWASSHTPVPAFQEFQRDVAAAEQRQQQLSATTAKEIEKLAWEKNNAKILTNSYQQREYLAQGTLLWDKTSQEECKQDRIESS
ncbi:hypothetical protein Fcan01_25580 [Folsomia candida]|uniref:Uncharacterized protein n=1 Tax=Folsomia candida TaxID=158441 RepID=A0A226D4R1_FOLCA|nr:hypothetical protein Fcan01_25580 [Folsomia candida]